ncbi:hypothetical protein ACFONN_08345 [Dyella humi]|uniref:Uncharacterized protein n=1 Tax=Dyella humi TaxID=1770547 RepID=A0ABW8IIS5_9GAMM
MDLDIGMRDRIGRTLARNLDQSEEGSVAGFLEFSERDISDIRLLLERDRLGAIAYVLFRLKKATLNSVVSYCADVIERRVPVEEWLPSFSEWEKSAGRVRQASPNSDVETP